MWNPQLYIYTYMTFPFLSANCPREACKPICLCVFIAKNHTYYHNIQGMSLSKQKTVQKHELKLYRCSSNMWSPVIMRKVGGSIYIKWITILQWGPQQGWCEDLLTVSMEVGWIRMCFLILGFALDSRSEDLENRIRDRMAKQKVISGRREVRNAFGYHPNKMLDFGDASRVRMCSRELPGSWQSIRLFPRLNSTSMLLVRLMLHLLNYMGS